MKTLVTMLALAISTSLFAQSGTLVVDTFEDSLGPLVFGPGESETLYQRSPIGIIGGTRRINFETGSNPYDHSPQVTIRAGVLAFSAGFDVNSGIRLSYGYTENGPYPLNLDLSGYRFLKIKFKAKSSTTGAHITFFTNNDRGSLSMHVPKRDGSLTVDFPLSRINKLHDGFTLSDVDHMRILLDSRPITGCNMAIEKIWFQ